MSYELLLFLFFVSFVCLVLLAWHFSFKNKANYIGLPVTCASYEIGVESPRLGWI